ncbi:MAG TPA: VWA domain-containing protein [Gaiellaceae bacterium]
MTRASLRVATVAAAFLLFVPLAGATPNSDGLRLTRVRGPVFPAVTFALSLPGSRSLTARDVHVTEGGVPVSPVRLVPARKAAARTFGTVLVLDASRSMHGKPIAAAMAAARSFAAERNPNEALGVIVFNDKATTILPFTTSKERIDAALKTTPQLRGGTHIFDAVSHASAMLRRGHISSGSIIVLSDGADTGSTGSLDEVAHRALGQNARIYTVGLADKAYRPQTLTALATAGNGEYLQANARALGPLFAHIGSILSNEYLLSYTSPNGPGTPVDVAVTVPTVGTATAAYRTPRSAAPDSGTGGSSIESTILNSSITMVLIALMIGAVLAIFVIAALQPQRTRLPSRIAEFVSIPELQRDRRVTAPTAPVGEPTAAPKDWFGRLRETLEIARITVAPEVLLVGTAVATILAFVFIRAISGSAWWGLLALGVPYLVRAWVLYSLRRQRLRFSEQLTEALQVIASALRSGHSFAGALAVVVESSSDPMRREMQRVVADEQLGMPIQRSLAIVADRMASTDVDQLALVAELQRQAGGDMAEVVDRVAETVRERFDLRRLVQTLTTQGRMSRWIVTLLPIGIVLILEWEHPGYFHPLVASTAGRVIVGFAVAWAVVGSFIIKRIVEIEV